MERAPHPKAPGLEAGITEEMIHDVVHAFYAKVRADALLGPIFNAEIDDWDAHLHKLCTFWSSVTLMTGRYKGRPMPVHARLPGATPDAFKRWLALFRETVRDLCPPTAAAVFIDRSERIGESLQIGIALHRGEDILPPVRVKAG
jgi:hemoglobin